MEADENVVFFGEDIGVYGGAFGASKGLLEKFGSERIIDTPISENSIVGLATGAAITGLKPNVEFMFKGIKISCSRKSSKLNPDTFSIINARKT